MPKLATLTRTSTIAEIETATADAARTLLELRSTPTDKRGVTHAADLKETADYIMDNDLALRGLSAGSRSAAGAGNAGTGSRSMRVSTEGGAQSLGAQVVGDAEYREFTEARKEGRATGPYVTEVRNLIGGFTAGAYDSGADGILPVGSPVMVPGAMQRRRMFVRNLMSVQGTGLRIVPYVRELNALTNETGAGMTSEGSAKTEVTMQFENYQAIIEKITAWIPASDEILTDAPTLRGYIDTRLAYMLDLKEEQQLLSGSGTSPQLPGLDNLSGKQTQSVVSGDFPATIGLAIGKIENVDGDANGVACNPLDYWTATTKRYSTQFDNGFGAGSPDTSTGGITWGVPAVRSRAVASGTAYVADWRMGATVFDRQQTTIKVGDQHSDYFTRNLVVILGEKRVGVAWHRPSLFCLATVPTT